ncbi:DegT/DnrJ/EryC1/StrS family aminotransferase [Bradyrhizobium sp.]|uniref:DegT/DnrJ/EryC1/StrS family aminotransferase n=1 Tax=Bradyrhizobium sp. TaxID=376 RepID=UPI002D63E1A5|nr:DegT/DnrJ/EryC1/StrS family aminotransferase [Bradyrhizobium sp.]HZR76048.1 DegT/DnrJ/EryC1/StrS family aminotransferase [Bradyrhizobium sp.]
MIPVFEPDFGEEEIAAVVAALRRGEISGSFGTAITDFEEGFAAFADCKYGVAVTSGTTALHLAVAALDLKPGDEVLLSSSTNIATALAIIYANAVPVPVDSERETWNLDLDLIEGLITPRTRAIIPVHLFGHPVDMDRLNQIAKKHNLVVIEDCAEAHGAKCRGRVVGSFGDMNCFSFYANKVITTGEGGMVTTNDAALAERLRLLRNLAFTQPRYWHERAGFNFRMTGFQAAFGVAQLKKIDTIIEKKRSVARKYSRALAGVLGLQLPAEKDWAFNVYWMYALIVGRDYPLSRNQLAAHLKARGVDTRTFFCPMNQQPCLKERPGYRAVACPVADEIWETGLYLPSSTTLTDDQISTVCDEIARAASVAKV